MGGTSTDVCRVDAGEPERTWETRTAGVRIRVPMLAVHTVAAGGDVLGNSPAISPDSDRVAYICLLYTSRCV